MAGFLVVTDIYEGKFRKVSFEITSEAVRCAKSLDTKVTALVIGHNIKEAAPELNKYGVDSIITVDNEKFANAYVDAYTKTIVDIAKKIEAEYIFFPASILGKTISAAVGAKFETSALTDCISFEIQEGKFLAKRPIYAGKAIVTVAPEKKPIIASLRPNVFKAEEKNSEAAIEDFEAVLEEKNFLAKILELKTPEGKKIDLTEASIIVSGGRGMQSPENFKLIEDLAEVLGAAVGASRAVVDDGWRPHSEQVGQTGKTVAPQLYIACGISGAIQHLAGMKTSKVIVAVNTDPEAPIFQVADYGIVGDALEVIPKMIEEAKALKQ